jgi:hypothetical protein
MGGWQCCGRTPGFDCFGLTKFFDELTLGSRAVTSPMRASTNDQRCDIISCDYVADMAGAVAGGLDPRMRFDLHTINFVARDD